MSAQQRLSRQRIQELADRAGLTLYPGWVSSGEGRQRLELFAQLVADHCAADETAATQEDYSAICPLCGEGPSCHFEGECMTPTQHRPSNPPCARCEIYRTALLRIATFVGGDPKDWPANHHETVAEIMHLADDVLDRTPDVATARPAWDCACDKPDCPYCGPRLRAANESQLF